MQTFPLSTESQTIAGVVLLTIVTIESGGVLMMKIARGKHGMTEFQKSFARAGHGHAGALVTLSLICLVLADSVALGGIWGDIARLGVPVSAILLPAGFFFSSMGRGEVIAPNRLIVLVWCGMASLAIGVVTLGIGLLAT